MLCKNCQQLEAATEGLFCSVACATERYSIVMQLLDSIHGDVQAVLRGMDAAAVSLRRVAKLL